MLWVFLGIRLRFTDRVSHSYRSQEWTHSYCNHHRANTIRAYQVTRLAKPGATEPFITAMRHVITMMTSEIIKFVLWVFSVSKNSTIWLHSPFRQSKEDCDRWDIKTEKAEYSKWPLYLYALSYKIKVFFYQWTEMFCGNLSTRWSINVTFSNGTLML